MERGLALFWFGPHLRKCHPGAAEPAKTRQQIPRQDFRGIEFRELGSKLFGVDDRAFPAMRPRISFPPEPLIWYVFAVKTELITHWQSDHPMPRRSRDPSHLKLVYSTPIEASNKAVEARSVEDEVAAWGVDYEVDPAGESNVRDSSGVAFAGNRAIPGARPFISSRFGDARSGRVCDYNGRAPPAAFGRTPRSRASALKPITGLAMGRLKCRQMESALLGRISPRASERISAIAFAGSIHVDGHWRCRS